MTRLYQIHNLVIFLKNILWSQGRRQSSPPSPAALNFGMKWGSAVAHFILCWHAICFLHTSLKSHKNNYNIISTAFLKKQLTKTHMVAKLNTGQCPACWELLTHKHGGNQRQRQKARHEVRRQRLHRLGDWAGWGLHGALQGLPTHNEGPGLLPWKRRALPGQYAYCPRQAIWKRDCRTKAVHTQEHGTSASKGTIGR